MANTLLITKETGGYFTFLLTKNGVAQLPIQSIRNDLLVYGTQCHFKTGSGANIIKEQFILPTDITIVASGTFTFTTVAQLWAKLIEIGYFDWLGTGGTGTGVDRFDDLLDTFKYIGNNGYAVVVNESEQKLKAVPFYNYSKFTELQDTPDTLVANKMVVVNSAGTALELKDQPTIIPPSLTSVGSFHYVDLATITTPLTVLATVEKKITNDTASIETNVLNAPYGISSMWDAINNQLDFSQTSIGDLVTVIPAIEITTTATNQTFQIYIKMGIGSATPTTKQVYNGALAAIGTIIVNPTRDFTIDSLDNRDYPAEIYILSSANATVKSGELDIKVVRKDINILNVVIDANELSILEHDAFEKTTIVDADEFSGLNSDADWALFKITALNLWLYFKAKIATIFQYKLVAGTNISIDNTDPLAPIISASGGGASVTNLAYTPSATDGTVTSDTGTDATIPLADATNAGLLKPAKYTVLENTSGTNTGDQDLSGKVTGNTAITGATKTKVTYDSKGLVTSGADATTADIASSTDKRYLTDAQLAALHPQETATTIAAIGHAATTKTVLVDADEVTGQNSATSFSLIRTVWSDVYTYIKSKTPVELGFACSDETTALTTGLKVTFRMPYAMTLSSVRISLTTAPTISTVIVDVKQGGTSIFSTLVSIDASELTSTTAATAAVITTTALTDDAEITIHVTQIGSGDAGKGLKAVLIGKKS